MITFELKQLPVSVNKLYFNKFGRRVLSKEGRAFKTRFITAGGGASKIALLSFDADKAKSYALFMEFFVQTKKVVNANYGKDKRTKNQFKRLDTSNLIKIVEDSISELTGIPDQNNFVVLAKKTCVEKEEDEKMVAFYGNTEDPDIVKKLGEML